MALQLNLTQTQFGSPAPQAYAKITNFFGNKDNIHVQVGVYFSKDAKDANMSTVMEHAHYIAIEDLNGKGDLIPAIYEVLKTMSPYLGATDV